MKSVNIIIGKNFKEKHSQNYSTVTKFVDEIIVLSPLWFTKQGLNVNTKSDS